MKNRSFIIAVVAALFLVAGSASRVQAQAGPIVGGYGDISTRSKDAKKFANYAVATRSTKTGKKLTLVKILKAEQQVVAGMNYRICMTIREGNRKAYAVTVVVYQDLRHHRSLSKWKKGECIEL